MSRFYTGLLLTTASTWSSESHTPSVTSCLCVWERESTHARFSVCFALWCLNRYYISKGAIVDQLGGDLNSTPLHWATRWVITLITSFCYFFLIILVIYYIISLYTFSICRQGHLSMVVQLMKLGADPSLIDGEGCTCVHLAAQFGHTSIVAYLIAKGQVMYTHTLEQGSSIL